MKRRFFSIIALTLFTIALISSCKSREKCPAYGEVHKHRIERIK